MLFFLFFFFLGTNIMHISGNLIQAINKISWGWSISFGFDGDRRMFCIKGKNDYEGFYSFERVQTRKTWLLP
jgi:hypothetical protein